MTKSHNEEVQKFLTGVSTEPEKYASMIEMRELIFKAHPEAKEKIMYGGIVFFLNNEMFSGLFINKNHISLEFSNGFQMKDPGGHLEGKGKYRRHLKIMKREDVSNKEVSYFVKQAIPS
jgi:hypothetical protein